MFPFSRNLVDVYAGVGPVYHGLLEKKGMGGGALSPVPVIGPWKMSEDDAKRLLYPCLTYLVKYGGAQSFLVEATEGFGHKAWKHLTEECRVPAESITVYKNGAISGCRDEYFLPGMPVERRQDIFDHHIAMLNASKDSRWGLFLGGGSLVTTCGLAWALMNKKSPDLHREVYMPLQDVITVCQNAK